MRQEIWTPVSVALSGLVIWLIAPAFQSTKPSPDFQTLTSSHGSVVAGWSSGSDRGSVAETQVARVETMPESGPWTEMSADPPMEVCAPAGQCGGNDLKAVAARTGQLNRMAEITRLAGLGGASAKADTKITIFAPSDAAFAALPEGFRVAILRPENKSLLIDLLLHHVVIGKYTTRRLMRASARHYGVEAIDGTLIEFTIRRGLDVNGAGLVAKDLEASNGVLHVIDKVLVPHHVLAAISAQTAPKTAEASADHE